MKQQQFPTMPVLGHRPGCPNPCEESTRLFVGREGDPIKSCSVCGAYYVHKAPPEAQPPPGPGTYVCGNHPDRSVTWRGTGCSACDRTRRRRRRDRRPDPWAQTDAQAASDVHPAWPTQ